MKVYAFDPTLGRSLGNVLVTNVPYEALEAGPVGQRFAVVDYDGSTQAFYVPVDLDDPNILLRGGLDPTESDPRFHQQMVYAVATETLERFQVALGRRVHWREPERHLADGVPNRLYLYPHAMVQANAFYSPGAHGILFGYFRATDYADAEVLPGQTIFTCLSHDIIAHETTHAVVDGIRAFLLEPTNIDVPAFHEAFADLSALFVHFSHREAVLDTVQRTGGLLYKSAVRPDAGATASDPGSTPGKPMIQAQIAPDNPLLGLARQFGQVSGLHSGLRSALGTPATPDDIAVTIEPHARGSILVAAVFDAFFTIYVQQTADLFSTFRAAGGSPNPVELPAPLAYQLARVISQTAVLFFGICARALDYLPPVDVTFGDFLRALITADFDLYPTDEYNVRDAIMQAFRSRGIYPENANFFSEDSLRWPPSEKDDYPALPGLRFGDPNGLTREEKDFNGNLLRKYAADNAQRLGFSGKAPAVPSFHPMFRADERGRLRIDMVVEIVETIQSKLDPNVPDFGPLTVRGGVTLMIRKPLMVANEREAPTIRYVIPKHVSALRENRQRAAYLAQGVTDGTAQIDFGILHGV